MNTRCTPKRVPSAARFFTLCRLTVQPRQSYSIGGQRSSGQLTGKPAGTRPDYWGRWCAVSRGHPGRPNPPSPRATLGQLSAAPWELLSTVGCGIAWARDGERWEAWEQQHHPASLPDIAAMVLNYLAADMGETLLLPSPAPKGEEPSLPSPAPKGEEPSLPSPPAEGECLLVSAPPPEGQEHECPQPKMRTEEEECLLFPSPPAEGEYLLVSPSLPRGEEDQELPPQSQHYPLSTVFPATEGDQHQSPATEGDYPLLSPPPPGNYLLLLPPSSGGDCPQLPPPPAEGEFLLVPSPLPWEDCLQLPPPPAEGEFLLVLPQPPWEDCLPLPPPPAEGEYLLVPPQPPWEDDLPRPPPPAEGECLLVPPLQREGEEALPPSQPEGEEALPPSQPEGEEALPPSQPEGEEPLPPSPPSRPTPPLPSLPPQSGEIGVRPLPGVKRKTRAEDIYVFGVGEDIDEDEINLIASKKDKEKHVFKLENPKKLAETFEQMIGEPMSEVHKLENPEKLAETFEQMIGRGQQSHKIRLSVMAMTRRDESDSVGLCGLYRESDKESESEKTKKEKYPWHVSITITRQSGKEDCKGAVVSERHVLTSAHCFTTEEQAKDVKVIIDDSTIGTPGRSTVIKVGSEKGWRAGIGRRASHTQGDPIHTGPLICKIGERLKEQCYKDALKAPIYKDVPDIDWPDVVTDRFLCTGGTDPVIDDMTCKGDSGGSLFLEKKRRMFQVGVISWGNKNLCVGGRRQPTEKDSRDYHINLFEVQDFLRDKLGTNEPKDLNFIK
ncbi:UNVERIFIED_CONTAM: hypothetical protein FKN15_049130 [Acipenser sinensis]